uniref:glycosyltransferase n=1 Tax=Agathobacter sp. TaxID=2021311 RepID=UPI004055F43B
MSKKQLTISMLVSGREDTTEKSLRSLQKLKKELDAEIILVDTGCGKSLLEKIENYADCIIPFTWCNDFAKARNVGLKAAQGEWFLYLDDDEWFEDVTPVIDFFRSGEYEEYHQAVYQVHNYTNLKGTAYTTAWVSRMIRIEEDTHFEGRVHESLVPARGKCKKIHAFVHHYGYAYEGENLRKEHVERNIAILEPLIEEEPNNLRWKLQIIQEYVTMQMWEKLRRNGEAGLKLTEYSEKAFHNLCRGSFYAAILLADVNENKEGDLRKHYDAFMADSRNPENVKCALSAITATGLARLWKREILQFQKSESEAVSEASVEMVLQKIADCANMYFCCLEQYQAQKKDEQQELIDESAVAVAEYMTEQMQLKMCYVWAESLADILLSPTMQQEKEPLQGISKNVWLNEQLECLKKWQPLLIEDMEGKLSSNGEFLELPDEIWKLAEAGLLPLEEMLLSLPIGQWIVQMMVLEPKGFGQHWQKLSDSLAKICCVEDIRYALFDMKTEIMKMRQIYSVADNIAKMDYAAITQALFDFASANLHYADFVYTDAAFCGEMEILEPECKAAFWLSEAFCCEETDWSKKLECLKKAAKAWQVLGEIIKRYAVLIGEERTRMQSASQNAQNELLQMAESIKPQVYTMVENGMLQEALAVIKQLRGMVPEDKELAEMEKVLLEEML